MDTDKIAAWTRFYAALSDRQCRSFSGADKVDAVRNQLTAAALRKVLLGATVDAAVAWYWQEWNSFAEVQNKRVADAPKLKYGPMEGCSSIHYKWADKSNGEQGETNIRLACSTG